MAYQALARKWRPRRFSEIVGQDHVVRALLHAIGHDRLHHAYLLPALAVSARRRLHEFWQKP